MTDQKLFVFNDEFGKGDTEYITKPSTYVVAKDYEEAIRTYNKGPNNNEDIWSVKSLGNPILIADGS